MNIAIRYFMVSRSCLQDQEKPGWETAAGK
jgi:hypothetical protein